jgi:hypothetical protein
MEKIAFIHDVRKVTTPEDFDKSRDDLDIFYTMNSHHGYKLFLNLLTMGYSIKAAHIAYLRINDLSAITHLDSEFIFNILPAIETIISLKNLKTS